MSKYATTLASKSPRRQELLQHICPSFQVKTIPVDESYNKKIQPHLVSEYIAKKKIKPWRDLVKNQQLIIVADTVVVCNNQVLGKPKNANDAYDMLSMLSDKTHHVYTTVVLLTQANENCFTVSSEVIFDHLTDTLIHNYINTKKPLDKAGAYGIQDEFALVAVKRIQGSYTSIMGLPLAELRNKLTAIML